jgi:uncharacterized protein DUF4145
VREHIAKCLTIPLKRTATGIIPRVPWHQIQGIAARTFVCGYCNATVGSDRGWLSAPAGQAGTIYVSPACDKPTYFHADPATRTPGPPYGNAVQHVPADVNKLYDEARNCYAINAYTGSVLLCRKLLMNIAVSVGATPNQSFMQYVEYLAANNYVPPNGKAWVDHIRKKGNEATHEIQVMTQADARDLISFSEMLLKFIYEFPKKVPAIA